MNPRLVFVCILLATLPALWTIAHGETEIGERDPNSVDAELRSNEGIGAKTDDEVIQREEERINPDGFSVHEQKLMRSKAEKFGFQAEVNKLMNIIIHSLYSNREVFLRELISNASDALDKLRVTALTDKAQLDTNPKLEIKIKADKEGKTLQIIDSGIGMTKQDLLNNLGTIAKSGTQEFLEKLGKEQDSSLIGQFGVGFYSAFLVADTVTVITKNNADKQYVWESDANGEYTVTEDPRGDTLGRGTIISLHLKDDALEFLNQDNLKGLVTKYSEFINFPIQLWASHEEEKEVDLTEEEIAELKKQKAEEDEENEEIELEEKEDKEEEDDIPKTKKVKETVYDWELTNETKPIWTRNPKEITDEEYNNFYKAIAKTDFENPLMHIHFNAEGEIEFKSLLYIPGSPPVGLFDPNQDQHKGIKLYVRRVFITDEFKDILPKYLNFVKGVVDSDDLPLNVSREMLQEHKLLSMIKKKLVRKAIAMFQTMADDEENKDKFTTFWKNYGTNIKLGMIEDSANRVRLSKLLMFLSSKTGEQTTLQTYVDRMKEGQNQIYYLAGESLEQVEHSPLLEQLNKRGYEVLYMVDPIDEYAMSHMEKFDGKYKMTNIGRDSITFDDDEASDEDKEKETEAELKPVTDYLKKILGSKIEKVKVSKRLATSPSTLVADNFGPSANMDRIMKAQALGDPNRSAYFKPRKILEINAVHPIIVELKNRVASENVDQDAAAKDVANLLYETAALTSGWTLEDPADFSSRIVRLMNSNLSLDPNASVPEKEVRQEVKAEEVDVEEVQTEEVKDEL